MTTQLVERPDLSKRTALSKSEISTGTWCEIQSYFSRTDPRPWTVTPEMTFGSSLDAAVELAVSALRSGQPIAIDRCLAAATEVALRDDNPIDLDEIENAIEQFGLIVAPQFDWTTAKTQATIRVAIDGLGDCEGHPDLIIDRVGACTSFLCGHRRSHHLDQSLDPEERRAGSDHPCRDCVTCKGYIPSESDADGDLILDVKAASRAKSESDIYFGSELPFYALLRGRETGDPVRHVGYLTWIRLKRPMWQVLVVPVTDDLLAEGMTRARRQIHLRKLIDTVKAKGADPTLYFAGPKFDNKCLTCAWVDSCEVGQRRLRRLQKEEEIA